MIDLSMRSADGSFSETVFHPEALLRHIIDHALAAIALFDNAMCYLAVSRRFVDDYRLADQATLVGRSHHEVFPESSGYWSAVHARVLTGEALSSECETFPRSDGSVSWARWKMVPWKVDGAICGALLFTEDVTERKETEAALLRSDLRLRLVQQISGIAYTDWTHPNSAALVSPEFAHIYGLPLGQTQVELSDFISRIHPEDQERIAALTPFRIGCGRSVAAEFRICRPDGEVRWISVRAEAFAGPSGQPERLVSAHQDITDLVGTREKLALQLEEVTRLSQHLAVERDRADQANRAKSRFLAGLSHELRTPLNGILGYAQLLQIEGGLNATQHARVTAMQGAGTHLLKMITHVLNLSEIEAGHVVLQVEDFNLMTVATACVDLIRPIAETKGLALRVAPAGGMGPQVRGDPIRLQQVLLNLLGNAAKFTCHGSIEMRLQPGAGGVLHRIEIADTGPGVPIDQRPRLFNEFERLDTDATRSTEGAGLGLALSARMAAVMGGQIGYEENPGGGSVFWLELPSSPPSPSYSSVAPGLIEEAAEQAPSSPHPLHVLVVDDAPMNRDIASSFLVGAGHTVTCANNGVEAVAAVRNIDFDVVLMDVRMPQMDGLEATRRIRSMAGARSEIPILALTAQAFSDEIAACREAGMNNHLVKPYERAKLLAAVAQAAAGRHQSLPRQATAAITQTDPELPVLNWEMFARTTASVSPARVKAYLRLISDGARNLLHELQDVKASNDATKIANAAHALAGSASMLGFERLAYVGRCFERAVLSHGAEAQSFSSELCVVLHATLDELEAPMIPTLSDPPVTGLKSASDSGEHRGPTN